ncbi:MAG TPA: alpha/beta hydrolase-fold protein [Nannocystaceae bacterium]|nr:alpha/beta hydrolase-fold protein [Nannocystaceae bacterium]
MGNRIACAAVSVVVSASACGPNDADPADASSSSSAEQPTTIVPNDSTSDGSSTTGSTATTTSETTASDESSDTGSRVDDCTEFDTFVAALIDAGGETRAGLVDGYRFDAMYSEHGLPLHCEGRLITIAWDPDATTLALTGDFSDWDPAAHPMTKPFDDFPLWIADIAIEEPLAPSLYKLVRDGDTFVADPWARRFGWDEFGEYSLTDARDTAGHHERWIGFAEGVGALTARDVVVYVPTGALQRDGLAVLYMHDGQNLFSPDAFFGGWHVGEAVEQALVNGDLAPTLVVGIDNTELRFDEYTHVQDDIGGGLVGGRADEYADFVALGVKPFIDARYPTDPDRDATTVLGSSLGGLVSLYIAWRHPDVFASAGSMSGTLGWGTIGASNDRILELYAATPPDDLWVYLDSGGNGPCPGGEDTPRPGRADSDNFCVTIEMRDLLVELGWAEPQTLVYAHAPGATHDEAAWAARLPGFLTALGDR